jgi:hypothetical protein
MGDSAVVIVVEELSSVRGCKQQNRLEKQVETNTTTKSFVGYSWGSPSTQHR